MAKSTKRPTPEPGLLGGLYARWTLGESMTILHAAAIGAGFVGKKGKFRRALIALAGGKAQFLAERKAGAGGQAKLPVRTREVRAADDAGVKRLRHGLRRSKGWTTRYLFRSKIVNVKDVGNVAWRELEAMVFISPKGREYIAAKTQEKADLIAEYPQRDAGGWDHGHIRAIRLKRLDDSAIVKKQRADERLAARGAKAHAARRATKRATKTKRVNRRRNATDSQHST